MDLDAVFADKKKRAEPDVDLAPIPQYDFLKMCSLNSLAVRI